MPVAVMPCDYSKYPVNWKTEIVPRILKRADNKCEICGLENHTQVWSMKIWIKTVKDFKKTIYKYKTFWVKNDTDKIRFDKFSMANDFKKVRVVLTIAHLDHDETNHNVTDDRLKAMCQYCHLNYDAKEKYRRIMTKA